MNRQAIKEKIDKLQDQINTLLEDNQGDDEAKFKSSMITVNRLEIKKNALYEELFKDISLPKDLFKADKKIQGPKTLDKIKHEERIKKIKSRLKTIKRN